MFGKYTKFLVAAVTAVSAILTSGLLHGTVQHYATVLVTVAGALGVYALPNRPLAGASPSPTQAPTTQGATRR